MKKETILNTINELQQNYTNKVYKDACTSILDYIESYNNDDDIDINNIYHDLANTQGGSWLVYNDEIIQYFDDNKIDINNILYNSSDTIGDELQLNTCQSILELITRLVFAAYEQALNHILFEL